MPSLALRVNPEGGSRKRDVPVVASDAGKSVFGRGFSRRSSLDGRISSEFPRRVSSSFGEAVADAVGEGNGLVYVHKLTSTTNKLTSTTKNRAGFGIEDARKLTSTTKNRAGFGIEDARKLTSTTNKLTSTTNKLTSTTKNRAEYGIEAALKSKNVLILHRKYELIDIPDVVSALLSEMSLDPFDYKASIKGYYWYWSESRSQTVYVPSVTGAKANPCMRINKVYASISRTIRNLDGLVELCDLKSPYMLDMVLTIPSELSRALYSLKDGGDKIVWDAYKAFLKDLDVFFAPAGKPGSWRLGISANLHRWKSDLPIGLPHYHFHSLFMNYSYNRADAKFERFQPFLSEKELKYIRGLWLARIHEIGDALDVPTDEYIADNINIHFGYISMAKPGAKPSLAFVDDSEEELCRKKKAVRLYAKERRCRAVLVHKLKYKSRPFFSDFVEWFPDNSEFAPDLDKDGLKRMILLTENDRTRTFGFLRGIAGCIENVAGYGDKKAGKIAVEKYKKAVGLSPGTGDKTVRKSIQDPEGFGELVFGGSIDLCDLPPCPIIVYSRSGRTVIPPPDVKSKEG